ncbi:cytochrome P450 [Mycena maculata]|uniref:Cytochrome P450 n=1 Tax=Mycena maculata TaxID=230809 RepID=A0AAD7IYQ2_9AGAR|nr:cytochrome P450 [Mycena maculata]
MTAAVVLLLLSLAGLVLFFYILRRRRWAKNIDGPRSKSLILGNLLDLIAPITGRDWQIDAANRYGGVVKIKGLFNRPSLLVSDPMALHHILVKEPTIFEEWPAFTTTNSLLFGDGLVATIGEQHRKQRKMLNPVFSWKYLRGMSPTFFTIGKELEQFLHLKVAGGPQEIEMTACVTQTALEFIGQNGFGHSFGSFSGSKNPKHAFAEAVKELAATVSVMVPAAPFLPLVVRLASPRLRRRFVEIMPFALIQKLRYIVDIMAGHMEQIFLEKKQSLSQGGHGQAQQHDIMTVLLKANQDSSACDRLTDEELLGQMATLVFTATDTTSGAISRLLHLLAQHPEVQNKLVEEITAHDEEPDYDTLASLPYMDAVIRETLRVFPPIPMVFRQTTQDASIPLLHPIQGADGSPLSSVHVPKGTDIFIGILGANHHRATWGEDASEWKPERWLSPLPESVTANRSISGVYSHMMTFLAGTRACIGFSFSQMEMKVVLFCLLRSLQFSLPTDKEIGWNMGLLMTPVLRGNPESIHSHMPLQVRKRE